MCVGVFWRTLRVRPEGPGDFIPLRDKIAEWKVEKEIG